MSLRPKETDLHFSRGETYIFTQEYTRAIADFTETIRLKSDYGDAYLSRGLARGMLGLVDEAKKDLRRALELGCIPAKRFLELLTKEDEQ